MPTRSNPTFRRSASRGLVLSSTAMAALALTTHSHGGTGNLIQDGDFELASVPAGGFIVYPGASTSLPDWTVGGVEVATISGSYVFSGFTFVAQSGSNWMDLSGATNPDPTNSIAQSITTEVGRQYDLSFYVGSAWRGTAGQFRAPTIDVAINGGTKSSFTNSNIASNIMIWEYFQTTFVATSTSTVIQFTYGNAAGQPNYAVGLDTVVVTTSVIPAPGVLCALLGAGSLSRRRRIS